MKEKSLGPALRLYVRDYCLGVEKHLSAKIAASEHTLARLTRRVQSDGESSAARAWREWLLSEMRVASLRGALGDVRQRLAHYSN